MTTTGNHPPRRWCTRADTNFLPVQLRPFIGFWLRLKQDAAGLPLPARRRDEQRRAARAILDHRATVLCCTPTYALHLAEVATARDSLSPNRAVKILIVAGEPAAASPPRARGWSHCGLSVGS